MLYGGICDDEKEIHEEISRFFGFFEESTGIKINLTHFFSGEDLLQHYQSNPSPSFQFLILDIEMSGINGLVTAKHIRSLPNREVAILFLSSYPEYVMESFDVLTFQYLLKPLTYEVFQPKIMRLYNHLKTQVSPVIFLKDEHGQNIVPLAQIIAISKLKHALVQKKLMVITSDQELIITGTISSFSMKLAVPFLLIFRSVIVNMDYIRRFTSKSVVMSNSQEFPISRTQVKQIKDTYAHYMAGKIMI